MFLLIKALRDSSKIKIFKLKRIQKVKRFNQINSNIDIYFNIT